MHRVLLRNQHLASLLQAKIVRMQLLPGLDSPSSVTSRSAVNLPPIDPEIESQLEAHGFHFTDLGDFEESPETSSTMSDSYNTILPPAFLLNEPQRDLQSANYGALLGGLQPGSTAWSSATESINIDLHAANIDEMFQGTNYDFVPTGTR